MVTMALNGYSGDCLQWCIQMAVNGYNNYCECLWYEWLQWWHVAVNVCNGSGLCQWMATTVTAYGSEWLQWLLPMAVTVYDDEAYNTQWLQQWLPMALNGFNDDCLRQWIVTIMNAYKTEWLVWWLPMATMATVVTIIVTMALKTVVIAYGSEWQQCWLWNWMITTVNICSG